MLGPAAILIYIIVNVISLGFRLMVGQNKQFEDVTLDSGTISHYFLTLYTKSLIKK